ncbi:hypothetical protein SO802_029402 [Lithocarpus litseifolius]|uniref:Uncharacterized protein n=1 Tax=Lithocarpus litseifolius TaxID=425828 RepID=A0AAW2BV02_9ROSI
MYVLKKLLKMFVEYSLRLGATLFSFLYHQSLKLKGLVYKCCERLEELPDAAMWLSIKVTYELETLRWEEINPFNIDFGLRILVNCFICILQHEHDITSLFMNRLVLMLTPVICFSRKLR